MQITHILTELGTGLKRNVSMTLSLVVTTSLSLTLVGVGLLVNAQATETEEFFNGRSTVQVVLCAETSSSGGCVGGEATRAQREQIEAVLDENPEVDSYTYETAQQQYEKAAELASQSPGGDDAFDVTVPSDFSALYTVIPVDPQQVEGIEGQLTDVGGIEGLINLAERRGGVGVLYDILDVTRNTAIAVAAFLALTSVLLVSNTIRLTAYARRKEIGIMRLVGASSWHIQLPFILESLLATLVAGLLACGALAGIVKYGIIEGAEQTYPFLTVWIGWPEAVVAGGLTMALAAVLGLIPPLLLTRKYIDV